MRPSCHKRLRQPDRHMPLAEKRLVQQHLFEPFADRDRIFGNHADQIGLKAVSQAESDIETFGGGCCGIGIDQDIADGHRTSSELDGDRSGRSPAAYLATPTKAGRISRSW